MKNYHKKDELTSALETVFTIALTCSVIGLGLCILFGFFDK